VEHERRAQQPRLRCARADAAPQRQVAERDDRQEREQVDERAEQHQNVPPPVIGRLTPVMKSLAGESKKAMAPTTSPVAAMRPRGDPCAAISFASPGMS